MADERLDDSSVSEPSHSLLAGLRALNEEIVEAVLRSAAVSAPEDLARIVSEEGPDTTFAVDRVAERRLVDAVGRHLAAALPLVVVAEGIAGGRRVVPEGAREEDAAWVVLVDPIDGTRGWMWQKRSAWTLSALAPNHGAATRLRHVEVAVGSEIPLLDQRVRKVLWAVRGRGATGVRVDIVDGTTTPWTVRPSSAASIEQGFVTVCRFFPGGRDLLGEIDEELVRAAIGAPRPGRAACFEDQLISTGGQLHGLAVGSDRFVADLRPTIEPALEARGEPSGLACHPYDLATALVAEEAGVILTDPRGEPLDAPLDVDTPVAWVGYANEHIRAQVEPGLRRALERRGLIAPRSARGPRGQ